jgi:hypothetical protein
MNLLSELLLPIGFLWLFDWGPKPVVKPHENFVITKSGSVIDCKGGEFNSGRVTEILVISGPMNQLKDVTIRNCQLKGSIRVFGMGRNGEAATLKKSSVKPGHTLRAQSAAPTNILISNMDIEAAGRTPVYIAPGATRVTLENSLLTGYSTSVAVYLDAESARNTIRNNTFLVTPVSPYREVIAIDGSAENVVANNRLPDVRHGGIYLYRNCGEGGVIRHQPPIKNRIEKNSFGLRQLSLGEYGIWLGSRNGNRSYCEDDKGFSFGSSDDNRDHANNNSVLGNVFDGSPRTVKDDGKSNLIKN